MNLDSEKAEFSTPKITKGKFTVEVACRYIHYLFLIMGLLMLFNASNKFTDEVTLPVLFSGIFSVVFLGGFFYFQKLNLKEN